MRAYGIIRPMESFTIEAPAAELAPSRQEKISAACERVCLDFDSMVSRIPEEMRRDPSYTVDGTQ